MDIPNFLEIAAFHDYSSTLHEASSSMLPVNPNYCILISFMVASIAAVLIRQAIPVRAQTPTSTIERFQRLLNRYPNGVERELTQELIERETSRVNETHHIDRIDAPLEVALIHGNSLTNRH
ncbi:MAG: hypothetical protein JSR76_05970 [Verrucomicrobia bacterium]|nr:hypothetical protein [Verrucomicrobiota bacterium]